VNPAIICPECNNNELVFRVESVNSYCIYIPNSQDKTPEVAHRAYDIQETENSWVCCDYCGATSEDSPDFSEEVYKIWMSL